MHSTPASLLERLRQPEQQAAWTRFVRLYTPQLFHWARRLGLRDADAADLVQDILTILIRKLPQFRYDPRKSFRAWLRTVEEAQPVRARSVSESWASSLAYAAGSDETGFVAKLLEMARWRR